MTIDLESLRGILKDEQQGAQMEGPLTDEELASLSEHCCYPDGILDRVIAELTARRARDAEVEALVAALREAMEWNWLDEDARPSRIADQCDAALLPFTGAKP